MRRKMNGNDEFAKWFRMQREDRQLTEEQAAETEHLDLSLDTILMIEAGRWAWAQLPYDIKEKIESKFGEYGESGLGEQESLISYRQAEATAFLVDIREEILQELEPSEVNPEPLGLEQPLSASELAVEHICRCGTPVLIKDEGRCPKGGKLGGVS